MDDLHLDATKNTPEVDFAFSRHRLLLRGESYPENAFAFYAEPLERLEAYLAEASDATVGFDIHLRYFNSSSTKALFRIFDLLQSAAETGITVQVRWWHEKDDDNAREFGEDFQEDFKSLDIQLCEQDE